jgi:hypothetical protein
LISRKAGRLSSGEVSLLFAGAIPMSQLFKALPLLAVLAAAPALAAPADPHADHHPAPPAASAPAKPDTKADGSQGCPMMTGQMMGGQMMGSGGKPGAGAQPGMAMGSGGMTQGDGHMHCMSGEKPAANPPPAVAPAPQEHDHK